MQDKDNPFWKDESFYILLLEIACKIVIDVIARQNGARKGKR